jgi:hypothetical protein
MGRKVVRFLTGMGTAISLFPVTPPRNYTVILRGTDRQRIAGDWKRVGDQIRLTCRNNATTLKVDGPRK